MHPIYVHCLDGRNVTSLVMMCLRKLQNWNQKMIIKEAERYVEEFSQEDLDILKQWKGEIRVPEAQFIPRKWLPFPSPTCNIKDRIHPKGIKISGYFAEDDKTRNKKQVAFNLPNLEETKIRSITPKDMKRKQQETPPFVETMTLDGRTTSRRKRSIIQSPLTRTRDRVSLTALALEVRSNLNVEHIRTQASNATALEIPVCCVYFNRNSSDCVRLVY